MAIGHPRESEAAPYYFKYIDLVTGDDPLTILENQLEDSRRFFPTISEEKSLYRYAPEKWSLRQVLNHITDTERMTTFRAFWFARGFDSPLPSYDQGIAACGAMADQIAWSAHVQEFRQVRESTLSLFRNFPEDVWLRSGIASDNLFTVRALAYIVAGHFVHHVTLIRERYLQDDSLPISGRLR